DW
ncbi:hypothetical protein VC87395_003380B, partial [Vibrio paracholerae 87395]